MIQKYSGGHPAYPTVQYARTWAGAMRDYENQQQSEANSFKEQKAKSQKVPDVTSPTGIANTFTGMSSHHDESIVKGRLSEVKHHAEEAVKHDSSNSQIAAYHHAKAAEGHYAIATHPSTNIPEIHQHYRAMSAHEEALRHHLKVTHNI